jgi:hypothetical protein
MDLKSGGDGAGPVEPLDWVTCPAWEPVKYSKVSARAFVVHVAPFVKPPILTLESLDALQCWTLGYHKFVDVGRLDRLNSDSGEL